MIKFNEVTWYSRSLAALFILGVFPALTFYIGRQYEQVANLDNNMIPKDEIINSSKEPLLDSEIEKCRSLIYQQPMNSCSSYEAIVLTERLDNTFKNIINILKNKELEDDEKGLTISQKKWEEYANGECKLQSSNFEGGSLEPLIENECMIVLTKQRIKTLEDWSGLVDGY